MFRSHRYASQDAEAARRISEALRAAGIVVWFDQSELRGGDVWDASIRKKIKECALFVPVISLVAGLHRPEHVRSGPTGMLRRYFPPRMASS
jgi:hypothetical protein